MDQLTICGRNNGLSLWIVLIFSVKKGKVNKMPNLLIIITPTAIPISDFELNDWADKIVDEYNRGLIAHVEICQNIALDMLRLRSMQSKIPSEDIVVEFEGNEYKLLGIDKFCGPVPIDVDDNDSYLEKVDALNEFFKLTNDILDEILEIQYKHLEEKKNG